RRFRDEVLEVTVGGKSIADALELTVSEALAFFRDHREVARALKPLADVGLEYLRVGQPVPTLSGGEAQRPKLPRPSPGAPRGRGAAPQARRASRRGRREAEGSDRVALPVRRADHGAALRRRREAPRRV